jgi:Tfp pilus assembly pilus retraction ATPase PilT
MRDLLTFAAAEQADAVELHVGSEPVIVLRGEDHLIEGPSLTPEDAEALFREIAGTRRVRELRRRGQTEFLVRPQELGQFLVRAQLEAGYVGLDIRRLPSEQDSGANATSPGRSG